MMNIDLPCSQFTRAVAQYRAKKMAQIFRMECTCSRITNAEGISVYRLQLQQIEPNGKVRHDAPVFV